MNILVVDDHPDIRQMLALALESFGHRVDTAANGSDGMAILLLRRPDLVLLDIVMPDSDGEDFLNRKRQSESIMCTPVILISGYEEQLTGPLAQRSDVFSLLSKPIDMAKLERAVKFIEGRLQQGHFRRKDRG